MIKSHLQSNTNVVNDLKKVVIEDTQLWPPNSIRGTNYFTNLEHVDAEHGRFASNAVIYLDSKFGIAPWWPLVVN
jgi:hypothetical protein